MQGKFNVLPRSISSIFDYEGVIKCALIILGGDPDDSDKVLRWAIGNNWKSSLIKEADDKYREMHLDCEVIYGSTSLEGGAEIMVREFLKNKEPEEAFRKI